MDAENIIPRETQMKYVDLAEVWSVLELLGIPNIFALCIFDYDIIVYSIFDRSRFLGTFYKQRQESAYCKR